jgi:hypothetical protein
MQREIVVCLIAAMYARLYFQWNKTNLRTRLADLPTTKGLAEVPRSIGRTLVAFSKTSHPLKSRPLMQRMRIPLSLSMEATLASPQARMSLPAY